MRSLLAMLFGLEGDGMGWLVPDFSDINYITWAEHLRWKIPPKPVYIPVVKISSLFTKTFKGYHFRIGDNN